MNAAMISAVSVAAVLLLLRPSPAGWQLLATPVSGASRRPPGRFGGTRVLVAAAGGLSLPMLVPAVWTVVTGPLLGVGLWYWLGRLDGGQVTRCRQLLAEQLPEALGLLVGALSAGSPTRTAVEEVAAVCPTETRQVLESVLNHIRVGRSEEEAWAEVASDDVLAPVWGRPARDLARNANSGAAIIEVLRWHATESAEVRRSDIEKQAKTVGIRSVLPLMTCFLPAFVLVGVVPIIAGLVGGYLG